MVTQAQVTDHVVYDVVLLTDVPPQESFSTQLAMIDDPAIPIDKRLIIVSPTSYRDDLDPGDARDYATVYFAQALKAQYLFLSRRLDAATSPYWLWGSASEADFEVWKAITDGDWKLVDNTDPTPLEDTIVGIDFSAVTDIDQVYALLETRLQAIAVPNITGLDEATIYLDAAGRISVDMPDSVSGATAKTIAVVPAGGVGTDLAPLMDSTNGIVVPGYDAETVETAFDAIRAIDDSFYNVESVRDTDDQNLTLAGIIEGMKKQLTVITDDEDCVDPVSADDIGYQLQALSYQRTMSIFDRDLDTQFTGAAIEGRMLPTVEGRVNYAYSAVTSITANGLTVGERKALKDKGMSYIETVPGTATYLYPGYCADGTEKRLVRGVDWFESNCQNDTFAKMLADDLWGFDNPTLNKIQDTLEVYSEIAIERNIFVDTPERPFLILLPDADDFTQAERASHDMVIDPAFTGWLGSAVNDVLVRGTATI